jgi:hypothetical protein
MSNDPLKDEMGFWQTMPTWRDKMARQPQCTARNENDEQCALSAPHPGPHQKGGKKWTGWYKQCLVCLRIIQIPDENEAITCPFCLEQATKPKTEAVNHPAHYGNGADDPYEHIKVVDAWGLDYRLGNATKYLCRAGKKAPYSNERTIEDLNKALWYLTNFRDTVHVLYRPQMPLTAAPVIAAWGLNEDLGNIVYLIYNGVRLGSHSSFHTATDFLRAYIARVETEAQNK